VKKPGLLQPVEKKGKCASSMARTICRPKIDWADLDYKSD
jgi:hypothetical protein